MIMLYFPKTSKQKCVSSIVALNIHSPKDTGDWHSAAALHYNAFPQELYIYGEGEKYNTNKLLGDLGIIDGTERLNVMGYFPENTPVWIADHPRACVDYLYYAVIKRGNIGEIMLDEWFPSIEDKKDVYYLINVIESYLNDEEKQNLNLWKLKNPIE